MARRRRPAQRPVGPDPLRRVPHPVPPLRPLRLVVAGAVRGGPAAAGGGHAVAARPPGQQPAGPGHPPRPHRRSQRPAGGGPGRRPGGARRPGRGARPAQPPHVVDPRRGGPRGGAHRSGRQRHGPRRRPATGRAGLRRPHHRGHLPLRADQPGHRLLRQRGRHGRGRGRAPRPARAAARLPAQPVGQLGRDSSRAPSSTSASSSAHNELASPSRLERLVTRGRVGGSLHPSLVASYPVGDSWPPAADLRQAHRRTRRVRRWGAGTVLATGIIDLVDSITPPLRGRLHTVEQFLPLRASEAAGALVAVAGLALIALGRGILRGQRRAWRVAVVLLAGTVLLHLVAGADFEESVIAGAALAFLLVNRKEFQAASDATSLRSALVTLGVVAVGRGRGHHRRPSSCPPTSTGTTTTSSCPGRDVLGRLRAVRRDHHHPPPPPRRPVPHPRAADHRPLPGGRDPLPADPTRGRPPAGLGPGRRVPGPRHRPPPRRVHPRLLRPPLGQEVVLPPGQPGRLRRLRRGLPHLPRPDRPAQRARAGLGGLPRPSPTRTAGPPR